MAKKTDSKQVIARRIRSNILDAPASFQDIGKDLTENIGIMTSIAGLSTSLEDLTEHEEKLMDRLLETLMEIPLTNRELAEQERKTFDRLIDVIAMVESRLEQMPENERAEIEEKLLEVRKSAQEKHTSLDFSPRTAKERMGMMMGFNPAEVREKGLINTVMGGYKEAKNPPPIASLEEIVESRKASLLSPLGEEDADSADSKNSIMEKTENNSLALADLSYTVESIHKSLENLVYISKISRDHLQSLVSGKSSSIAPKASTEGVDTVDEFNENVTARKSDATPSPLVASHGSMIDFSRNALLTSQSGADTIDEFNENVPRETSISERKSTDASSSGSISSQLEQNAMASKDEGGEDNSGGGGGGGILSGLVGTGIASIGRRMLGGGKIPTTGPAKAAGNKAARDAATKKAATLAATKKAVGRGAAKSLLKKIPLVGLAVGAGLGIQRMLNGDFVGAAGEVASGAASLVPGLGTAASIGIDAALMGRDIKNAGVEPSANNVGEMLQETDALTTGASSSASAPTIIDNKTINNYSSQSSRGMGEVVPSVRTVENSFVRFQDKRMTRIL
jgi:hypothetical protein